MILIIECKIDSDTLIDEVIELKRNSYLLKLFPDENKTLNKVTIECKYLDYENYVPKVTIKDKKIDTIVFPEENFYPEQLSMLQYLESFSSLDKGVKKIYWESPTIHWIAENDEERIAIKSYTRGDDFPKNDRKISKEWFQNIMINKSMVDHLTEPLSFYRIGVNHYFENRYIEAFFSFYLMLEGFFANGNTAKRQTIDAFMNSPFLIDAIKTTLSNSQNIGGNHKKWFDDYSFINKEVSADPIRKMVNILIDERGRLAHYSVKSKRRRNNLEERNHQSLAWFAWSICQFSSIKLRLDPFRKKDPISGS